MKEKDLNMQMLHDRLADSQQAAVGQQVIAYLITYLGVLWQHVLSAEVS